MRVSRLTLLSLLCVCSACSRAELPSGYMLYRRDSGVFSVVDGKEKLRPEIVHPNISKIATSSFLILGFAEKVTEIDGFTTPGGYFVLDTRNGIVSEGLSMVELERMLKTNFEITEVPFMNTVR